MIVAAIQMCSSHNPDENLNTAAQYITEAAQNGAKLVVLPEMFAFFGMKETDKLRIKEQFGIGTIQAFLAEQAKTNQVWIVGGTLPIEGDDPNKIRAACLVYDDMGRMVARYDKMHLFDVELSETEVYKESNTIEAGDEVVTVDTPLGKMGIAVCYDVRFPELFRALVNSGAELFVLPSAFTVKTGAAHWQLLCRARAVENFCYMIGAAQGGSHTNGRQTYGHSLIVDPWGTIIAEKNDNTPGVIYADVDLEHLNAIRKSIPALLHQKISPIPVV